eukprot:297029-Hanusia_phi.AAC.2
MELGGRLNRLPGNEGVAHGRAGSLRLIEIRRVPCPGEGGIEVGLSDWRQGQLLEDQEEDRGEHWILACGCGDPVGLLFDMGIRLTLKCTRALGGSGLPWRNSGSEEG